MPRGPRLAPGGFVYHALNRGVARRTLFFKPDDYAAFERTLLQALSLVPIRLLAYCLMPNHWHLVLWPERDGELSAFLRWLTNTHTQRHHAHYRTAGTGHLYQGRFKSFPIQSDPHLLTACRYVERNPLRANLVPRAELWPYSSLARRLRHDAAPLCNDWPVPRPPDRAWLDLVNRPQSPAELDALRTAARRSSPFGTDPWRRATAHALNLPLRPQGRPPKLLPAPAL